MKPSSQTSSPGKTNSPSCTRNSHVLEGRADMINQLEPELQGATQRMFERLQAEADTQRRTLQAAS
jgi:hypothetical protein